MREERGSREGREREGGKGGREGARKQKVSLLLVVLWHFSLSYFRDSVLRLCRTFWLRGDTWLWDIPVLYPLRFSYIPLKLSFILH